MALTHFIVLLIIIHLSIYYVLMCICARRPLELALKPIGHSRYELNSPDPTFKCIFMNLQVKDCDPYGNNATVCLHSYCDVSLYFYNESRINVIKWIWKWSKYKGPFCFKYGYCCSPVTFVLLSPRGRGQPKYMWGGKNEDNKSFKCRPPCMTQILLRVYMEHGVPPAPRHRSRANLSVYK